MSNMSYCRFENTLNDLRECFEHMEDEDKIEIEDEFEPRIQIAEDEGDEDKVGELYFEMGKRIENSISESESQSRISLLELCQEIANKYKDII